MSTFNPFFRNSGNDDIVCDAIIKGEAIMPDAASLARPGTEESPLAHLEIVPWQPALGAIVSGLRYDEQPVPESLQTRLRQALHIYGVLIFAPETVTAQNFTQFVRLFGDPVPYSGPHTPTAPDNPSATVVDSRNDQRLRNHIWHIDGTFRSNAPKITALFGHTIPAHGGDTLFSNATLAYDLLDPLFAAYLDTLIAINSADATGHLAERYLDPEQQARERARMPPFEHPVVRVHPETGRKQIFVSESYTAYIKGVSRMVSQSLLAILFEAIKAPEVQARYTWTPGALVVWDNRVVQHRGIKDYGSDRRLLYRATLN
jgi:taurine dioxygenase